jgi:hypothetical protein
MAVVEPARRAAVFARSVHRYLRADSDPVRAERRIRERLEGRGERFVDLLRLGVYQHPDSPLRRLLEHAGAEAGDVAALVRSAGLEGALEQLRAAGVYVTLEELKGHAPVVRGSLRLDVGPLDFENPLAPGGIAGKSGGTTGRPVPTVMSFEDLVEDADLVRLWVEGARLTGRPFLLWRSVPPARSGLRGALRSLRTGLRLVEWWSPTPVSARERALPDAVALRLAWGLARAHGRRLPWPSQLPLDRADVVAREAGRLVAAGTPPVVDGTAGAMVRACRAASEAGLDLTGVVVRTGGEPLTEAKREVIERVGARVSCHYAAHEVGRIGFACADGREVDDVHVASGRIAVIQAPSTGDGARRLLFTSLASDTPRFLLNTDIGDTGVLARRACACPAGRLGLELHVHTIRGAAKLTTDGTSIPHGELLGLVERTLPARFGGAAGDYQLVEAEDGGIPRLDVVVRPTVGAVDERAVTDLVLEAVGTGPAWRGMTAGVWRDGRTVRVVRREPYTTEVGKVHAFHVER